MKNTIITLAIIFLYSTFCNADHETLYNKYLAKQQEERFKDIEAIMRLKNSLDDIAALDKYDINNIKLVLDRRIRLIKSKILDETINGTIFDLIE